MKEMLQKKKFIQNKFKSAVNIILLPKGNRFHIAL